MPDRLAITRSFLAMFLPSSRKKNFCVAVKIPNSFLLGDKSENKLRVESGEFHKTQKQIENIFFADLTPF
jgi:hypothetical protein